MTFLLKWTLLTFYRIIWILEIHLQQTTQKVDRSLGMYVAMFGVELNTVTLSAQLCSAEN